MMAGRLGVGFIGSRVMTHFHIRSWKQCAMPADA